ncbi:MAG: hypothetical protein K2H77_05705 [Alistipes sp.]|nr:hypothetical protein [Alistipes sp.]
MTERIQFRQRSQLLAMTGEKTTPPAVAAFATTDKDTTFQLLTMTDVGFLRNALRCHLRRPASSMRRPQPPQMNSPAILFSANRTPHKGYVIASEYNERGNLNKTDHLCFNHNRPVIVLVQIATASAMPRDDGHRFSALPSVATGPGTAQKLYQPSIPIQRSPGKTGTALHV